jgi:hypothetical protein
MWAVVTLFERFKNSDKRPLGLLRCFRTVEATYPRNRLYTLVQIATNNERESTMLLYSLSVGSVTRSIIRDLMLR